MERGGQPGNKNGCKENRLWGDAIKRACAQADGETLRKLADRLIDEALKGNIQALKELGDRLDGRAHQSISADVVTSHVAEQTIFGDPDKATKPMDTP